MYCTKCGFKMENSYRYCPSCGDGGHANHDSDNQAYTNQYNPYQQANQFNYQQQQYQQTPPHQGEATSERNMVTAALGLGIGALVLPIPVVDLILGFVAIWLVVNTRNTSARTLWIWALVLSIIGTGAALSFTLCRLGIACFTPQICG